MPTDNKEIITSTDSVGQSFVFIQCGDFVSIVGLLVALLDDRLLIWSVTFHALWSLAHCIQFVFGSDKLDY